MVDARVQPGALRAPVEGGLTRRVYVRRGRGLGMHGLQENCEECMAAVLGTREAEHSSECRA